LATHGNLQRKRGDERSLNVATVAAFANKNRGKNGSKR
jgi:hypothetical protein